MSACAASVVVSVWTTPRRSVPTCTFIPKYHIFPFRVCFISGSRVPVAFFVELGALMIVASTIVPVFIRSPCASNSPRTNAKICSGNWWSTSNCRNRRIVVSSGIASSANSTPTNRRIDSLS